MPYSLKKLFDSQKLQSLLDSLQAATGITTAIMDIEGKWHVISSSTTLCDRFFHTESETAQKCQACRCTFVRKTFDSQQPLITNCPHGLADAVAPLIVNGVCLGVVLLGQVFLSESERESFRAKAVQSGFTQSDFMAELDAIPVIKEEQFRVYLNLITNIASELADHGADKLKALTVAEELRESELFLNLSQQIARMGGWKMNPETSELQWTDEVYRMLEIPVGTPITADYANQTFLVSEQVELQQNLQAAWLTGQQFSLECELQTINGRKFWAEFRCIKQVEAHGLSYLAGTLQDITAQKQINERVKTLLDMAEQANRLKRQLLSNLSHEFRTPLNGVIGFSQLLRMSELSDEQLGYLDMIDLSAQKELNLINNLLELTRIESKGIVLELGVYRLDQCLQEVAGSYRQTLSEKGLSLTIDIDQKLFKDVRTDKVKLNQILFILLENATKFTEQGGITVSGLVVNQGTDTMRVRISVCDTGTGIEQDKLKSIFESFSQADISNTRKYGGLGLGLPICHYLSKALGGRIWAESTPGYGSTFYVELQVETVTVQQSTLKETQNSFSVLLVDDDYLAAKVSADLLRKMGHEVTLAPNGEAGLALWEQQLFDLVIMDIHMPVMNGFEALKLIQMREQETDRCRTPIIAQAAYSRLNPLEQVQCEKFDGFITKPFRHKELELLIDTCIK